MNAALTPAVVVTVLLLVVMAVALIGLTVESARWSRRHR